MIATIVWSVLAWDVGMSLNGTRHSNSARPKDFELFLSEFHITTVTAIATLFLQSTMCKAHQVHP